MLFALNHFMSVVSLADLPDSAVIMVDASRARLFGNLDELAATSTSWRLPRGWWCTARPAAGTPGCRRPCTPSTMATWRAPWPRTVTVTVTAWASSAAVLSVLAWWDSS